MGGATKTPEVLFVCVDNAGRFQMAAGLVKLRSGDHHVRSAGSDPARKSILGLAAMEEIGVDLVGAEFPKRLTDELVSHIGRGDHHGLR